MAGNSAVELKGGMYTLLSLQIHSVEQDAISLALKNKVQQAPGFFTDTPIVLDLSPIEQSEDLDTVQLLKTVAEYKLISIAARVSDKQSPAARSISLPVLDAGLSKSVPNPKVDEVGSVENAIAEENGLPLKPGVVDVPASGPTIITRPVRSGQQIYASGGELVVLAQAGAGAELIADSNIHVYGPLRGRALCGVTGSTDARIFCRSLEAELVSFAGIYKNLEEIPTELKGKPAQILLDGDELKIESMN